MKALIIVILGFLVVMYVYTYIKYKKRKKTQISAIEAFRKTYADKLNPKPAKTKSDEAIQKYITKYNSSIDYVDRSKN